MPHRPNSNRPDPDNSWSRPSPSDAPAHVRKSEPDSAEKRLENALVHAYRDAFDAAKRADPGGTCNFDAPMLDFGSLDVTDEQREAALDAANDRIPQRSTLRLRDRGYGIHEGFTKLYGLPGGQGRTRTQAAEAAAEALREYDLDVILGWYRMD